MDSKLMQMRLMSLEKRVRRIEGRIGMEASEPEEIPRRPVAEEPFEPWAEAEPLEPIELPSAAKASVETPTARPVPQPPPIPISALPSVKPHFDHRPRPKLAPLSLAPIVDYAPPAAPKPVHRGPIEQTIGLKWSGWIGAIVLVIGAGLGIKYAVDNGWLGVLPPTLRLGLMYLGGFALIGAGEWVYRRVNDIASAGIFAAGVATLFLVSYAGHGMYGLYARDTAFVLMGISTLVGAAVAIRGKLVSVATLSILGGNIAPIVLHGDHTHLTSFLCYLLMLQIVALVLAWWGASRKWWMLRALSLATTAMWMLWVIAEVGSTGSTAAQVFLLIFAGLFQVEVIVSTVRRIREMQNISDPTAQPGVVFSMLVTAALTAGMFMLLRGEPKMVRGVWTLIFAGVTAATAFALPRRKYPSLKALAIGFGIQSALLLIAAVPMMFSGAGVVFGWAILACGFAAMGAILQIEFARPTAAVVWFLGAIYLIQWAAGIPTSAGRETWLTLFDVAIPAYLVVAAALTLAGNIVALLLNVRRPNVEGSPYENHLADILSACAGIGWVVASITALPTLSATLAFVGYAWLLFFADFIPPRSGLVQQSAIVLLLATLKWVVLDNLADRIAPGWSAARYTPVLNPIMGVGMLITMSLAAIVWIRRSVFHALLRTEASDDQSKPQLMLLTVGFVLMFVTIGFSFEIDRIVEQVRLSATLAWPPDQAKHLAWTMLWIASASAMIGLSRVVQPESAARRDLLRKLSMFPLLLAMKFLIIDTLSYRMTGQPANVLIVANLQTLTAMFVLGGLALSWFLGAPRPGETSSPRRRFIGYLAIVLLFWMGTLEIDRWAAFQTFGYSWFVRQVGFSIFWSMFGVGCVAVGFRTRVAALRYCGLGLLAITLAKVVVIDLGQISTGYRVLSFMGLGLLLLGTSVLYGKLSPRLLALGDPNTGSAT